MDEKDLTTAQTTERTPFLQRTQQSKFVVFCLRHKYIVFPIGIMVLLLPLLGLIALNTGKARAEYTSPVVWPSRRFFLFSLFVLLALGSVIGCTDFIILISS